MKNNLKVIIGYVLAIVVIVGVIAMIYRSTSSKTEVITYDKVVAYFQKEEVREFEIDNKNIELAAMKPAQDGKSWIMRLVNLSGECEKARIGLKFVPKEALECDLAEIPVKNPQMLENLAFGAHEIKSFILRY